MPRRTLHELDMEEAFPSQFIRESVIEFSKEVCDEADGQVSHGLIQPDSPLTQPSST